MNIKATVVNNEGLTAQQVKVLEGVCEGKTNKDIARALCNEAKTVEKLLGQIYDKLGMKWSSLNNRSVLIIYAISKNIVKISFFMMFMSFGSSSLLSSNSTPTATPPTEQPSLILADGDSQDDDIHGPIGCPAPGTVVADR